MKMLNIIQIVVLILSICDLTASAIYIYKISTMYPDKDYTQFEANPILKMALKIFGTPLGSIIGGIIVFGIVTFIIITAEEKLQYFIAGLLTMMNVYHWLNIKLLITGQ